MQFFQKFKKVYFQPQDKEHEQKAQQSRISKIQKNYGKTRLINKQDYGQENETMNKELWQDYEARNHT